MKNLLKDFLCRHLLSRDDRWLRWVEPDSLGHLRRSGRLPHKALGMSLVGRRQDLLTVSRHLGGQAGMHVRRGQPADAAMPMLVVVPLEELLAERPRLLQRAEAPGETGPVLQRLELAFREGIIVGDMGSAVGLGHAQVSQQFGLRPSRSSRCLGRHGSSAGPARSLVFRMFLRSAARPARPLPARRPASRPRSG